MINFAFSFAYLLRRQLIAVPGTPVKYQLRVTGGEVQ